MNEQWATLYRDGPGSSTMNVYYKETPPLSHHRGSTIKRSCQIMNNYIQLMYILFLILLIQFAYPQIELF